MNENTEKTILEDELSPEDIKDIYADIYADETILDDSLPEDDNDPRQNNDELDKKTTSSIQKKKDDMNGEDDFENFNKAYEDERELEENNEKSKSFFVLIKEVISKIIKKLRESSRDKEGAKQKEENTTTQEDSNPVENIGREEASENNSSKFDFSSMKKEEKVKFFILAGGIIVLIFILSVNGSESKADNKGEITRGKSSSEMEMGILDKNKEVLKLKKEQDELRKQVNLLMSQKEQSNVSSKATLERFSNIISLTQLMGQVQSIQKDDGATYTNNSTEKRIKIDRAGYEPEYMADAFFIYMDRGYLIHDKKFRKVYMVEIDVSGEYNSIAYIDGNVRKKANYTEMTALKNKIDSILKDANTVFIVENFNKSFIVLDTKLNKMERGVATIKRQIVTKDDTIDPSNKIELWGYKTVYHDDIKIQGYDLVDEAGTILYSNVTLDYIIQKTGDKREIPLIRVRNRNTNNTVSIFSPVNKVSQIFPIKQELNNIVYIAKNNKVWEVDSIGRKKLLGDGYLHAKILKDGTPGKIKLSTFLPEESKLNIKDFRDYIFIGEKSSYILKGDVLYDYTNGQEISPIDELEMSKHKKLYIKKSGGLNYIDFILNFEKPKIGLSVKTNRYKIDLISKSRTEIVDLMTGKPVFLSRKDKEVKIKDNISRVVLTALKELPVDLKGKELIQQRIKNKTNYIGNGGNVVFSIKDNEKEELVNSKILSYSVIDGSLFKYTVDVATKKAKIINTSDEGKEILSESAIDLKDIGGEEKSIIDILRGSTKTNVHTKDIGGRTISKSTVSIKDLFGEGIPISLLRFNLKKGSFSEELVFKSVDSASLGGKSFGYTEAIYHSLNKSLTILLDPENSAKTSTQIFKERASTSKVDKLVESITLATNNFSDNDFSKYTVFEEKGTGLQYIHIKDKRIQMQLGVNKSYLLVYKTTIDFKKGLLILRLKSAKRMMSIPLKDIMSLESEGAMLNDTIKDYQEFKKLKSVEEESVYAMKSDKNAKLKAELDALKDSLNEVLKERVVIQTKKIKPTRMSMPDSTVQEMKKNISKRNFTFEIGTKMKVEVKNIVEIAGNKKETFLFGNLKSTFFRDLSGNKLKINNAKLICKAKGDFALQSAKFYPIKIVFKDEYGVKQTINISENLTVMEYKDKASGYILDAVPSTVVRKKLRTLSTTTMLATIQGLLDGMTSTDDMSSALESATAATTGDSQSKQISEGVATGVSSGIDELIEIIKSQGDELEDILIVDPNFEFDAIFMDELDVQLKDKNN